METILKCCKDFQSQSCMVSVCNYHESPGSVVLTQPEMYARNSKTNVIKILHPHILVSQENW